jgi:molybdate transport system ATP-binding protein
MEDVNVLYANGVHALRNVSFTFRNGEHWRIEGPNGAGKSSLIALILGTHPQVCATLRRSAQPPMQLDYKLSFS